MKLSIEGVKTLLSVLVVCLLLSGCSWFEKQSPRAKKGTGIGTAVGGLAGLIIDSHNPWRGGIIGAALGAVSGGIIGNIIDRSATEAAHKNSSVRYQRTTENGHKEEIIAKPSGTKSSYKLVTVKYACDGKVEGEEVKYVPLQ